MINKDNGAGIYLKSLNLERGVAPAANQGSWIYFTDKNGSPEGLVLSQHTTTNNASIRLRAYNPNNNSALDHTSIILTYVNNGTKRL